MMPFWSCRLSCRIVDHGMSPASLCRVESRVCRVARWAFRVVPGRSLHDTYGARSGEGSAAGARVYQHRRRLEARSPLAPEAPRGLSHGNGCGTQELRISRWSALPGLLLNTTALEPVWGSSLCPANRQDFNAVTVLMRTARRLFSGVGVNFGMGRPPMVTLAKAAPVNPGAFALGARVVSANNAVFQSAFLRGNGRTARCGVGESGRPGGTKGLHERAGATPIDGAARAATGRCMSPSRAQT